MRELRRRGANVSAVTSQSWRVYVNLSTAELYCLPREEAEGPWQGKRAWHKDEGRGRARGTASLRQGLFRGETKGGVARPDAAARQELCCRQGGGPGSPGVWASGSAMMSSGSSSLASFIPETLTQPNQVPKLTVL